MLNILKAEISRYARDDPETVTPRSVSDEGSPIFEEGKFPSSNSTHKGFKVFSGVSWEGVFFPSQYVSPRTQ